MSSLAGIAANNFLYVTPVTVGTGIVRCPAGASDTRCEEKSQGRNMPQAMKLGPTIVIATAFIDYADACA